jgi:DtxR family Mn-dependent transcriptional regulator
MAGHGHSIDEYLEVIYFLAFPIGEYRPAGESAIASRVAEMLGVSRASAGEMLKRLEAEGLVERGEQKEAILTPAGIERAEKVVRKHRIIERFLTDFMGYTASESHVHADELGDTFTEEMVERMQSGSGGPIAARTGGPSSPRSSRRRTRGSSPSPSSRPGSAARSCASPSTTASSLHWFYDEGFVPGSKVEIRETQRRARASSRSFSGPTSERSPRRPPRACTSASRHRRLTYGLRSAHRRPTA